MVKKNPNIHVPVLIAALFAIAALGVALSFYASDFFAEDESPVSGSLSVGTGSHLVPVIARIGNAFSSYYEDAVIDVQKKSAGDLLYDFALGGVQAIVICGEPNEDEKAVIEGNRRSFRQEAVARGAVVCLIHRDNPSRSFSVDELHDFYTAGSSEDDLKPFISGEDPRFQRLVLELIAPEAGYLTSWETHSDRELFETVMNDPSAIGLLPVTSVRAFMDELPGSAQRPVIAAISTGPEGSLVVRPSQESIYEGRYPLSYTLYYLYDPYHPLATGFGAWMAQQGQKGFMQSALAPFRQPTRIIQLD